MEQPSYYSILTAEVRYDKGLKPNEKLIYTEITALSNKYGYCTASNGYFAELYDVSKETVSRWISHLAKKGYVEIKVIRAADKTVQSRRIYVSVRGEVLTKRSIPYCEKDQHPIDEKIKENITSNNNTSINNTRSSSSYSPSSGKHVDNLHKDKDEDEKELSIRLALIDKSIVIFNQVTKSKIYLAKRDRSRVSSLVSKLSKTDFDNLMVDYEHRAKYALFDDPVAYLITMLRNEIGD